MKTFDDIINNWCDHRRPNFSKPHMDGDRIIATDAHSIISAPITYFSKRYLSQPKFPEYKKVIPIHDKNNVLKTIDAKKYLEYNDLFNLNPVYEDCEQCEGTGQIECKCCGHVTNCLDCYKTGNSDKIIGYKNSCGTECTKIESTFIDSGFIKAMCEISVFLSTPLNLVLLEKHKACIFYCGEIQFTIMPLYEAYESIYVL